MNTIFSKSNEKVKYIKSLNDKKFRNKYNAFYLEGVKVVTEILEKRKAVNIEFIAYSKSIVTNVNGGKELLEKIEKLDIDSIDIEPNIFKYMTDTVTTQGVLIVLKLPNYNFNELIKSSKDNILVLDKVQDMGNIGTIIRSANAFNFNIILCTKGCADVYSPKVLRSTMGGILNVKIMYVGIEEISKLKDYGYKIITTSLDAKNKIEDLEIKNSKYAFVMGNEANGVSKEIQMLSDYKIIIPMTDKIESLNVGVASSIIMYESYKKTSSN